MRSIQTFTLLLSFYSFVFSDIPTQINWETYLSGHDVVINTGHFDRFVWSGNGMLGFYCWQESGLPVVKFNISRRDIFDHQVLPPNVTQSKHNAAVFQARLGVGEMSLNIADAKWRPTYRMRLYQGDVTIDYNNGAFKMNAFTHATKQIIVLMMEKSAPGNANWNPFGPADPNTSRNTTQYPPVYPSGFAPTYQRNVLGTQSTVNDVQIFTQPLVAGGEYVTAWVDQVISETKSVRYISIQFDSTKGVSVKQKAIDEVLAAKNTGFEALQASHQVWWRDFWQKSSMLSIPNTRWESYYYIQLYKMASACRPDGDVLDLLGPWYRGGSWPAIWWNLNVQLTYYPVFASNMPQYAMTLLNSIEKNINNLQKNTNCAECIAIGRVSSNQLIEPQTAWNELGNMPWAIHTLYMIYRHTMDEQLLKNRIYPILRKSVNYLVKVVMDNGIGSDGKYHIKASFSPECGTGTDAHYALAPFKWALTTAIETAERLSIAEPQLATWKNVRDKLVDYPQDPTRGFDVAQGIPYCTGHRHYSHLLAIFPLYNLNLDNVNEMALAKKSIDYFIANGRDITDTKWRGYSWTGSSSLLASIGDGNRAEQVLSGFLDRQYRYTGMFANTIYSEGSWVIETPFSAARSIQDMVLQSWGNKVRVFPAIPTSWTNIAIHDMLAEGAFKVSATLKDGKVNSIQIKSLAGTPLTLVTKMLEPIVAKTTSGRTLTVTKKSEFTYDIDLKKDETAIFTSGNITPEVLKPVVPMGNCNYWGSDNPTSGGVKCPNAPIVSNMNKIIPKSIVSLPSYYKLYDLNGRLLKNVSSKNVNSMPSILQSIKKITGAVVLVGYNDNHEVISKVMSMKVK